VQSVLIIESKSKDMRNPSDVFRVPYTVPGSESLLRSCSELGYKS
jgi:branched-chain amino acid transport system substrate-binding protein